MKIIILIFVAVSILLKLLNINYNRKSRNAIKQSDSEIALMKRKVSYKKYEKVYKKVSPQNTPQREEGDFLDFFLDGVTSNGEAIENKILKMYGEDINE